MGARRSAKKRKSNSVDKERESNLTMKGQEAWVLAAAPEAAYVFYLKIF